MFGIFMESLVIFKLYTGLRWLFALTLAAWLYLLFKEKNKTLRILFVYAPLLILLLFLFPLSRKFFVAAGLDGETYYRILWTIPMGMITCYGACRFFARYPKVGLVVMGGLVVACGSLVYKSPYISIIPDQLPPFNFFFIFSKKHLQFFSASSIINQCRKQF